MLPIEQTPILTAPTSVAVEGIDDELVQAAAILCNNYCSRRFDREEVASTYSLISPNTGRTIDGALHLTQTPIESISSLTYDDGSTPSKDEHILSPTSGLLSLLDIPANAKTINIVYIGGYSEHPPDYLRAIRICAQAIGSISDANQSSMSIGKGDLSVSHEHPQRALPFAAKTLLSPYKRRSVL